MHEHSIALALRRLVERAAAEAGLARVRRVHLRVGAVAGVEAGQLATAWEVVRRGGACDEAELRVTSPPMRWVCPRCAREVDAGAPLRCATCGGPASLEGGDELAVDRIEGVLD